MDRCNIHVNCREGTASGEICIRGQSSPDTSGLIWVCVPHLQRLHVIMSTCSCHSIRQMFWHTSAHVLGAALESLYGDDIQLCDGPALADGYEMILLNCCLSRFSARSNSIQIWMNNLSYICINSTGDSSTKGRTKVAVASLWQIWLILSTQHW